MTRLLTINVPGQVWYDALDPLTSGMEGELGLTELATTIKRGKGFTIRYEGVTEEIARELADYLGSRAETLLSFTEAEWRGPLYAARKTAERITEQLETVPTREEG